MDRFPPDRRLLLVVATPIEAGPLLPILGLDRSPQPWGALPSPAHRVDLLVTGIGKANSAGALARAYDPATHAGVLNLGVAGGLPGGAGLGGLVLADPSAPADDGLETPDGFVTCRELGFPMLDADDDRIHPDPAWRDALAPLVDRAAPIATVSAGAGTDALARARAETGAAAEAMEGAALGIVVSRIDPGAAFAEVRAISNTTGNRPDQVWQLGPALDRLGGVLGRLLP